MKKRIVLAIVASAAIIVGYLFGAPYLASLRPPSGPGTLAVKEFFRHWQEKNFDKMSEVSEGYGDATEFVIDMIKSPINFRNLKVNSESRDGQAWKIGVTVEVTDIVSVFASIITDEFMKSKIDALIGEGTSRGDTPFLPPSMLKIERFRTVNQTMLVSCSEGQDKCRVNLCRIGSLCRKSDNIMNYVLDAGTVVRDTDTDPAAQALVEARGRAAMTLRMATWLKRAMFNMDISEAHLQEITTDAMALFKQTPYGALANF